MISSDAIRGYTDTMILYTVLDEPSYGYLISKEINEICGTTYQLRETTLYSTLNRLERNGFLESFDGEVTYGKKRTYYRITHAGLEHYRKKCTEWELIKDLIPNFIRN